MISSICSKYVSPSTNLSSLRIATLFITAYCAFLRFDELAKLRCCDVNFHNSDYVKITITSRKADVYKDGTSSVLLARTGTVTCPYTILSRYFHLAALNCNSNDFVLIFVILFIISPLLVIFKVRDLYPIPGIGSFCLIP